MQATQLRQQKNWSLTTTETNLVHRIREQDVVVILFANFIIVKTNVTK